MFLGCGSSLLLCGFYKNLICILFSIFIRSPQCGIFTEFAFDTAKRGRGQSISIFRMSREPQQIMKISKQLKGVCLLRSVAKLLAISCNAQNDPRWQTGHFEAYFVGFLSRLLFLLCKSSFYPHSSPPPSSNVLKYVETFRNVLEYFQIF